MKVTKPEKWERPVPRPDSVAAPFFEAAARGELRFQQCPRCAHRQFYPRALCTACGADPEWATASGRGTIYTFTVIRQNHSKAFRDDLPYVVAMIELEEGVKMMGGITDCAPEDVRVGMAVEAHAVAVDDGIGVVFWRPAPA